MHGEWPQRCRVDVWRTADAARWVQFALCGVMFFLPFSIAGAQIVAMGALIGWALLAVRRRSIGWWREPLAIWALAFWMVACCSAIWGWRPLVSLPKLHRAAWFLLMLAVPESMPERSEDREIALRRLVFALAAGCAVALVLHIARLGRAMLHVPSDVNRLFWLYHQGSMRTPQFHMVVLLFLLAAPSASGWNLLPAVALSARIANVAGITLHFKRGVWMATVGGLMALLVSGCRIRPRVVVGVVVAVAMLACWTPLRIRLCAAPRQFLERGGRWELWTVAVPRILEINASRHPLGLGYGGMKNYELRHHVPTIESKLTHVHNNALQILIETGWGGLLIWSGWMVHWLLAAAQNVRRLSSAGGRATALANGTFAAICALLLNGVVEYNFGTGSVLMLNAILMGCTVAMASLPRAESTRAHEGGT